MDEAQRQTAEKLREHIQTAQRQLRIRSAALRLKQSPAWESFKQSLLSAQTARLTKAMDPSLDDLGRRDACTEARMLGWIAAMPGRAHAEVVGLKSQIPRLEEQLQQIEANTSRGGAEWPR